MKMNTAYHNNTIKEKGVAFCLLLAMILPVAACSGSGSSDNNTENLSDKGICANSCPKPCDVDNDCETAAGQLCCDYGELGSACVPAANCPRFCEEDPECETQTGEACLRTTLVSPDKVCTSPDEALKLCQNDTACSEDDKCCTIYQEPICLPPGLCPKACKKSSECETGTGEVCCATVGIDDPTLSAKGLCLHPDKFACPKACTTSGDCDNKAGELCCNGVCSDTCPKECASSSECTNQLCCKTMAVNSPWLAGSPNPGYPAGGIPTQTPGQKCSGYTGSDGCCVSGDPCGRAGNGACDCYDTCSWDNGDCSSSSGPGFCPGYGGDNNCCQNNNPCDYANDGGCDCDGLCSWDNGDCQYRTPASDTVMWATDSAAWCDGCWR